MARRLWRFAQEIEEHVATLLMVVLLVVVALQVFTRYVTGAPLAWTEELARYLFIYLVFVGASGAIRSRSHVRIDMFARRIPPLPRLVLFLAINLLILATMALIAWWGWSSALRMATRRAVTMDFSMAVVYAAIPIAAALMMLRTALQMRTDLQTYRRTGEVEAGGGQLL